MKKVLLLGTGSIGKRHLGNMVKVGARDITVVDLREDRQIEAQNVAHETYNMLPESLQNEKLNISLAKSSDEAYSKYGQFEGVSICMPPSSHLEEIEKAVENETAIFCEKPLSLGDDDWGKSLELLDKVKEKKIVNMVAYNYRFLPQLIKFKELLMSNVVGEIHSIRGVFSESVRDWHPWEGLNFYMSSKKLGGGAILDESHLIDICRWLFGEVTKVVSFNETISSLKNESIFETDDIVEMMVRFESGAIGSIHMDLFGKYHQKKIEVIGETGTLFWYFDNSEIDSNRIELWRGNRYNSNDGLSKRKPEFVYNTDWTVRNYMYLEEMKYFFQACKEGHHIRDDVPDIQDGLQTMAIIKAARLSVNSGKFETVEKVK